MDKKFWLGNRRQLDLNLITQEIYEQRKKKHAGDLIETNLFINGRGTTVVVADDERQHVRDSQPDDLPPGVTPTPTQIVSGPGKPENDLGAFKFSGATVVFGTDAITSFDPNLPGNVNKVRALIDRSGGTNVMPTSGQTFGVLSTGGTAPDGNPYTGTQGTTPLQSSARARPSGRSFVELDYRFLTNEISSGTGNNDHATFTITGANGMSVTYEITRDQLQVGGESFTPLARENVGGFLAGTDWLTLKLEVTPFLKAGDTTFSISVTDWESSDGDSALAIDRYQMTNASLVAPNSDLAGYYTAIFPRGVIFGEGAGEYRAPGLRGRANVNRFGPRSDGGFFEASTSSGDLVVNTPIMADTGPNKVDPNDVDAQDIGGEGGSVTLNSGISSVKVNSRIQVASDNSSTHRVSASGGQITISSSRSGGTGVEISNTGELLSLLNASAPGPGGKIIVQAFDSNVLVNGGKIIATHGEVNVLAPGVNRQITLNDATLRGEVVKVGALGSNGGIIIGGGQLSADSTLHLYAGNSNNGSITFIKDTTLGNGSADKVLSANTVSGVSVLVQGSRARIFTNNANYDTLSGGVGENWGKFTTDGTSPSGAQTFSPSGTPEPPAF